MHSPLNVKFIKIIYYRIVFVRNVGPVAQFV